jgi:hypothetical protein
VRPDLLRTIWRRKLVGPLFSFPVEITKVKTSRLRNLGPEWAMTNIGGRLIGGEVPVSVIWWEIIRLARRSETASDCHGSEKDRSSRGPRRCPVADIFHRLLVARDARAASLCCCCHCCHSR